MIKLPTRSAPQLSDVNSLRKHDLIVSEALIMASNLVPQPLMQYPIVGDGKHLQWPKIALFATEPQSH